MDDRPDRPTPEPPGSPPEGPPLRSRWGAVAAASVVLLGGVVGAVIAVSSRRHVESAPLKPGWTRQTVRTAGFNVGLPPAWASVSTTDVGAAFESLRTKNPKLADQVKGKLASSSLLKLLAFDVRSPTISEGFPTNLTIAAAPLAAGVDLDGFLALDVDQLRRTGGVSETIDTSKVVVPAGESALVQTRRQLEGKQTSVSQFLLVRGSVGYVLSFATLSAQLDTYAPLFEDVVRTFRFE